MARATTGIAYLLLGVVILGGLVFTVFMTIPAWSAWRAAGAQLKERVVARAEREQFLTDIATRTEELKRFADDARVLAVAFPETPAAADLAAVVGSAAVRNGLTVVSMVGPSARKQAASNETSAVAKQSQIYEVTVKVRGTYAGLRSFLRDLERGVRLLDIPELEVKSLAEQQGIEATLKLLTTVVRVPAGSDLPAETPSGEVSPPPSEPEPGDRF